MKEINTENQRGDNKLLRNKNCKSNKEWNSKWRKIKYFQKFKKIEK